MTFALATASRAGEPPHAVLVRDDQLLGLAAAGEHRSTRELLDDWDQALPTLETLAAEESLWQRSASDIAPQFVVPYVPRQIFCTGANYRKHVIGLLMGDPSMRAPGDEGLSDADRRAKAEHMMDERAKSELPYCFIKLPSCVVGPNDDVILPRNVLKPDWELELGVVIGRRARHVKAAEALNHVAGYAIVNDVSARDHLFRRDGPALGADWLSGKCFPTFLPFGPLIVPRQFVPDPYDLTIQLSVNGKVYQNETTADMLIGIERQIEYLSDRLELLPGDLICTGSPYGNGAAFGVFLKDGDVMEGAIAGLGRQRNLCTAER